MGEGEEEESPPAALVVLLKIGMADMHIVAAAKSHRLDTATAAHHTGILYSRSQLHTTVLSVRLDP